MEPTIACALFLATLYRLCINSLQKFGLHFVPTAICPLLLAKPTSTTVYPKGLYCPLGGAPCCSLKATIEERLGAK
jgi:hypothetical protein